jgi:hypothetical protein
MWTIRQSQMDALGDRAFEQALARIARRVAASHPEVPWALGEAGYARWVRELLDAAVSFDLTLEENLQRFVAWHAQVGVNSSVAEVYPWAFDLLAVEGAHEDDRVAAVELRMQGLAAGGG